VGGNITDGAHSMKALSDVAGNLPGFCDLLYLIEKFLLGCSRFVSKDCLEASATKGGAGFWTSLKH
jgi:hypothetical protein